MKHALYRMPKNKYLDDCLAVVTDLEGDASPEGFTRPEVITFICPNKATWKRVTSLKDLHRGAIFASQRPLLRIGSECMFGMFGDTHCNCEPERRTVLRQIRDFGGVYVHLPQEGQGMGLLYKAQELNIQTSGYRPDGTYVGQLPQAAAAQELTGGAIIDKRGFTVVADILKSLGLSRFQYDLLSQSKEKMQDLRRAGVNIGSLVDAAQVVTPENLGEYLTKALFKDQALTVPQVNQIIALLSREDAIPQRAATLLTEARMSLDTADPQIALAPGVTEVTRKQLFDLIQNPTNPSLLGSQEQLWKLLEKGHAYDEFQYELVLTDAVDAFITANWTPEKGDFRLWYERNHYFFPQEMAEGTRDLKIRITQDVHGRFLAGRLIHKVKTGEHSFRIRSTQFDDPLLGDLLQETVLKDYDQRLVESLTIPYQFPAGGVKIVIKRYTRRFRTLSIEGQEASVRRLRQQIEDALDSRLEAVRTDGRCFGPELDDTFLLDEFARLEFDALKRYNGLS